MFTKSPSLMKGIGFRFLEGNQITGTVIKLPRRRDADVVAEIGKFCRQQEKKIVEVNVEEIYWFLSYNLVIDLKLTFLSLPISFNIPEMMLSQKSIKFL